MMNEELKINKCMKKILKSRKNFKEVKTIDEANALLLFYKHNLWHYLFIIKNDDTEKLISSDLFYRAVFLKNTNPHDSKNTILGSINKMASHKKKF